jgi:hypothetical protein
MRAIRQIAHIGWGRSRRARRRTRWDEAARWFRLRYQETGSVQRALNLHCVKRDVPGHGLQTDSGR